MACISDLKSSDKPKKLISFPESALFDKIIAKDKIFQASSKSQKIKELFQEQVQRIRCTYELTEDKLNLRSCKEVPKILVIQVKTKSEKLDVKILETIDNAFGVPIFFEIRYPARVQYCACYRRRSEVDNERWVRSSYLSSKVLRSDCEFMQMPVALDMKGLYYELLKFLTPYKEMQNTSIPEIFAKTEELNKAESEIEKLKKKLKIQKQFNRKVELNRKINNLENKLKILIGEG